MNRHCPFTPFTGPFYETVPRIFEQGLVPLSAEGLARYRLKAKKQETALSAQQETAENIMFDEMLDPRRYVRTSTWAFRHRDGRLKIGISNDLLRRIDETAPVSLRITEREWRRLDMAEFSGRDLDRLGDNELGIFDPLPLSAASEHPILRAYFGGDQALQKEYISWVFGDQCHNFGTNPGKIMCHCIWIPLKARDSISFGIREEPAHGQLWDPAGIYGLPRDFYQFNSRKGNYMIGVDPALQNGPCDTEPQKDHSR